MLCRLMEDHVADANLAMVNQNEQDRWYVAVTINKLINALVGMLKA